MEEIKYYFTAFLSNLDKKYLLKIVFEFYPNELNKKFNTESRKLDFVFFLDMHEEKDESVFLDYVKRVIYFIAYPKNKKHINSTAGYILTFYLIEKLREKKEFIS